MRGGLNGNDGAGGLGQELLVDVGRTVKTVRLTEGDRHEQTRSCHQWRATPRWRDSPWGL